MGTQGQTISASIAGFFRRPLEGRNNNTVVVCDNNSMERPYHTLEVQENSDLDTSHQQDISIPEQQGTLVLADNGGHYIPPIVCIQPMERLRMLRQKQEWRRRLDSKILMGFPYSITSRNFEQTIAPGYTSEEVDPNVSCFSCKSSNTPSPVKKTSIAQTKKIDDILHLKTVKRKKLSGTKRQGTKWSGDFQYDLAEYDNITKQKKDKPIAGLDTSAADSPRLPTIKSNHTNSHYNEGLATDGLSNLQRNLLLKGPEIITKTKDKPSNIERSDLVNGSKSTLSISSTKGSSGSSKTITEDEKNKVILPSVGFNFLENKNADTPSKRLANDTVGDKEEVSKIVPSFSFTVPSKEQNANQTPTSLKFAVNEVKEKPQTPGFSFDKKTHELEESNEEENEPELRRKKRTIEDNEQGNKFPSFSFTTSKEKEVNRPSFSFGQTEKKSNGEITNNSSFSFGKSSGGLAKSESKTEGATKPFTFGPKKSEILDTSKKGFQLDTTIDKPALNNTPSFSFSNGLKNGSENGTFGMNQKIGDDSSDVSGKNNSSTEEKKPLFPFGKNKIDSSNKQAFSFGTSDNVPKPSATLGATESGHAKITNTTSLDSSGSDSVNKPSFSFGAKKDDNNSTESPSLFGSNQKQEISSSSAFTFGDKGNKLPGFSFSNGAGDDKKDTKSLFTFSAANNTSSEPNNKVTALPTIKPPTDQAKPTFSFTSNIQNEQSTDKKPANFSFSRAENKTDNTSGDSSGTPGAGGNAPKLNFSFGNNNQLSSKSASVPAQTSTTSGFSFLTGKAPNAVGGTTGPASSSFSFNADGAATKPPSSGISAANPFIKNASAAVISVPGAVTASTGSSAFSFGTSSTKANSNPNTNTIAPSTVFGSTQSMNTPFGANGMTMPALGQSGTSSAPISNPPSRSFTPSNTINLNFGNAATTNPSSIFSGAAAPAPQQIFGGTPTPPSQIFSTSEQPNPAFNAPGSTFGNMNNNMIQPPQGQPAPPTNFQLPQGRKLARMRQSRRG